MSQTVPFVVMLVILATCPLPASSEGTVEIEELVQALQAERNALQNRLAAMESEMHSINLRLSEIDRIAQGLQETRPSQGIVTRSREWHYIFSFPEITESNLGRIPANNEFVIHEAGLTKGWWRVSYKGINGYVYIDPYENYLPAEKFQEFRALQDFQQEQLKVKEAEAEDKFRRAVSEAEAKAEARLRKEEAAAEVRRKAAREAEMQRIERINKKYGNVIAAKIQAERYWIGMTTEMAREGLGSPVDINRTVNAFSTHEQWIYKRKYGGSLFLYFEDGILTSWQD